MENVIAWFTPGHIAEIVTVASALANLIPANTIVGKALHFIALNLTNVFGKKS